VVLATPGTVFAARLEYRLHHHPGPIWMEEARDLAVVATNFLRSGGFDIGHFSLNLFHICKAGFLLR